MRVIIISSDLMKVPIHRYGASNLNSNYGNCALKITGIAVSLFVLVLARTPAVVAQTATVAGDICPGELGAKVDAIANRAEFSRSRWGILIQPLSSTATLYSRDSTKYFIPASNVKLLTTAAALQKLGADFRIKTSVYSGENGSLYVAG
ncbi:MAG: D-alanyl-D-alanine carboxypeptidase, partial [Microcoleus sp.]